MFVNDMKKLLWCIFILLMITLLWPSRVQISGVWIFILIPVFILLWKRMTNYSLAIKKNSADFYGEDSWAVYGIEDFSILFCGLIEFLPENSIMRFEGDPSGKFVPFFVKHGVPEKLSIPKGTIWPKSVVYNVPATKEILQKLSELSKDVVGFEVANHFHVYTESRVLIDWYDAFSDPMYVSKWFPEERLKVFCKNVAGYYERHSKH